jgi:hypothetical protein
MNMHRVALRTQEVLNQSDREAGQARLQWSGRLRAGVAVRKAAGHPVRVVGTRGGEWLVRVLDHGLLSVDLVINRVSVCVGEGWL